MVNNDGVLIISYGKSRLTKSYKVKSIEWSKLLERFKNTIRTSETVEEFKAFTKQQQDDVKDVGGFIGGLLIDGIRSKKTVQYRSLITLDIDFADEDFLEKVRELDFAYCIYSTHKHNISNERYRLVIPVETVIASKEYEYISTKVAEKIGMKYFDQSTFQAERLMYWPSTCKDGDFHFEYSDKPWLKVKDISEDDIYTLSEENINNEAIDIKYVEPIVITEAMEKPRRENIEDKDGVIGAFCRCYDIYEAINKFIPDIYRPGKGRNRFTYYNSTTSNGFIVLKEGEYGYSHHSSDPAGNRLCDSFDLVRIHKFYEGDEKQSYKDMIRFALEDENVRVELNRKSLESAVVDFSDIDNKDSEIMEDDNSQWLAELQLDDKGNCISSLKNIKIILENDPKLKGRIALNEFLGYTCKIGDLPWHIVEDKSNGDLWEDSDDSFLRLYLEEMYKIVSPHKIYDGVTVISNENKYHPIRRYLNSLQWDGVPRLDRLFCDYYGAADNEYVRAVTRKSLVAAVARVFNPGIKFDYMLVLSGEQGIGKSRAFQLLGKSWFSDSLTAVQGKEAYEQLQGVWIIEMAELASLRGAEPEAIKLFISKSEDIFRNAYGKRTKKYLRQCVFFGTSNKDEFLVDATGNRRFWPVEAGMEPTTKDVWKDLEGEVDQIWAEAFYRYMDGEELYLTDDIIEIAVNIQKKHMVSDSKEGLILEFLEKPIPKNWGCMTIEERKKYSQLTDFKSENDNYELRDRVCAVEIWVELFDGDIKLFNKSVAREINDILRKAEGWSTYSKGCGKLRFGNHYGVQKAFVRDVQEVS